MMNKIAFSCNVSANQCIVSLNSLVVKHKDQQDLVINVPLRGVCFALISSCGAEVVSDVCVCC